MKRENPFLEIYRQCNHNSNKEKYELLTKEKSIPLYIDIELTNCCNIKCNMCPVGTGVMKRPHGMMEDKVFERICDQIEKYNIKGVRFIRWGEPTTHPKFIDYIGRMKQINGLLVHFNTNGMALTSDMLHKIVEMKIDSVKFSFQGVDEISYSEMRNGGKLEKLIENIKELYYIRSEQNTPYISVTTTTTYESEEDIERFKTKITPYCDEVAVGKTTMEHVDLERMKLSQKRYEIYKQCIQADKNMKVTHLSVCPELYDKLSINWDGTVSACCKDYDNQMIVGNIMEEDIYDIFHNKKEDIYRRIIAEGNYDDLDLCKNCYEYIPLKR